MTVETLEHFRENTNPITPTIVAVKGTDGGIYIPHADPATGLFPAPLMGALPYGADYMEKDGSAPLYNLFHYKIGGSSGTLVKTQKVTYASIAKQEFVSIEEI